MSSTVTWGKAGWDFLFNIALNIDLSDNFNKDRYGIEFFEHIGPVLPCRYCVEYYDVVLKDMPIKSVLSDNRKNKGKIDQYACTRWLYLVKNRVNDKLIRQETQCLIDKLADPLLKEDEKTQWAEKLLFTKQTPSFEHVLNKYMANRTDCTKLLNQKLKSCRHIPDLDS